MTNSPRWRAALGAIAMAAVLVPAAARAQDGDDPEAGAGDVVHSWTLVPASEEPQRPSSYRPNLSFDLAPGTTVDDAVTVLNYGTVPLTFEVFATDARNNPDGELELLPTDEAPGGVGAWVTVAQRHVTVPPGDGVTLPITVSVPVDARPGDHVGAVLASAPVASTGVGDQVVTFDRRTGTRLYVRVQGPIHADLTATRVRTSYRPSLNPLDGAAVVSYRIENRGNVRLGVEHGASVAGPFGLLRRRSEPSTIEELLPGEDVTVQTTILGVAAAGIAVTDVAVVALSLGGDAEPPAAGAGTLTPAPPWTLLAAGSAVALGLYALRAYRRHGVPDHLRLVGSRPR